jgi:predicted Zn-dependent protease
MKMSVVILLFMLIFCPSCVKSIAGEEKTIDYSELHNRSFGMSARDLLSADKYTSLKIEVQYMPGFKPDKDALYNLYTFLQERVHKPQGISIVTRQIASDSSYQLTTSEVKAIERKNRTATSNGKELALYILYTNGKYINDKIFGLAYLNTSAVIFGESIKEHSGKIGQPNRTKLETTVLLHEMGHLLGLMGKGTPMQEEHHDENHASHCKNRKCLMYYSIGTNDKFGYLIKGSIPELDEHCLADLRANGGK